MPDPAWRVWVGGLWRGFGREWVFPSVGAMSLLSVARSFLSFCSSRSSCRPLCSFWATCTAPGPCLWDPWCLNQKTFFFLIFFSFSFFYFSFGGRRRQHHATTKEDGAAAPTKSSSPQKRKGDCSTTPKNVVRKSSPTHKESGKDTTQRELSLVWANVAFSLSSSSLWTVLHSRLIWGGAAFFPRPFLGCGAFLPLPFRVVPPFWVVLLSFSVWMVVLLHFPPPLSLKQIQNNNTNFMGTNTKRRRREAAPPNRRFGKGTPRKCGN